MSASLPAILLASAGVGLAHSALPDHWAPLAVLARSRRDPLPRVARLSAVAGAAHVAASLLLGGIVVAVGLSVRSVVESRISLVVGGVLVLTGLGFLLAGQRGHVHEHEHPHGHDHGHRHGDDHDHRGGRLGVLIPLGAAASPDLTVLPVFLAAAAAGPGPAAASLVAFAAATVGTIVVLTTAVAAGVLRVRGAWIDRHANTVTGGVLLAIGALVALGVI